MDGGMNTSAGWNRNAGLNKALAANRTCRNCGQQYTESQNNTKACKTMRDGKIVEGMHIKKSTGWCPCCPSFF